MKDYLLSVMADAKHGLYVCELPTGYGKTYSSVQAIAEYVKDHCPDRKVFFLTTLKKNLPEEELKAAIQDDALFGRDVLRIRSNLEEVCDKLPDMNVPELFRTKKHRDLLTSISRYKKAVDGKVADRRYVEELRKQVEQDERSFRRSLADELNKVSRDTAAKRNLIRTNRDYQWIGQLYPAVYTDERTVLLLSINKFLQKNSPIIEQSYDFLSADYLKDSIIFIDEFDASKSTIKNAIIDKSLKLCDEYFGIFRQIVASFDLERGCVKGLSSIMASTCNKAGEKSSGQYRIGKLVKEARSILDTYLVDLNYKTVEADIDRQQRFLMKDITFHSLLGKQQFVRVSKNEDENRMDIFFESAEDFYRNKRKGDVSIYALLRAIDRFLFHFQQLLKAWSEEYARQVNLTRKNLESKMTTENAMNSILNQFRLTPTQKELLENEFLNFASITVQEETLPDNRFYLKGMKIYEFADSDDHHEQTYLNLIEVLDTPEKILLSLAQKATVIGLSATACFPTAVGNYDLEFLSEKLGDNLHLLPQSLLDRIKAEFEEAWIPYRDGRVRVHAESVDDCAQWVDAETFCKNFMRREIANIAGNYISNKTGSEYYQKNYCQILYVMRSFVEKVDVKSLLCLGMQCPKHNHASYDIETLKKLYKLACIDAGIPENTKTDVFFLGLDDFEKEKEDMCRRLARGEKLFIISSYATVGAGQNLQYPVSRKDGLVELTPCLREGDKRHSTKDIDAIYLGDITHLAVNTYSDECISKEDLLTMLFQIQELKESSELYISESDDLIKLAFRAHTTPKYKAYNKLFHVRSGRVTATSMALQAVGRICRTHLKNPNIYLYIHSRLLYKIEAGELKKRILPPEMEALVSLRESVGVAYTEDDQKSAKRAERISSHSFWDIKKYLADDWTLLSMKSWEDLRDLGMKFPTADDEAYAQNPDMKRHYITDGTERNRYLFSQISDYRHVSIFFGDDELAFRESGHAHQKWDTEEFFIYKMSEENCHLQTAMKYPGMREYFEEKQYATSFRPQKYMMTPVMFNNIYKGALGEVCGSFILRRERGIALRPITKPDKFEFFDYELAPGVYVDFKNWKFTFAKDRASVLQQISDKLDAIGGKRAYIVNLVQDGGFAPSVTVDERIVEIPGLIDWDGNVIPESINMFRKEDLYGFDEQV